MYIYFVDLKKRSYIIAIAVVILGAVLYQVRVPGSWYRYTSPRVHDVEFEWAPLKAKLDLPVDKYKVSGMRHYLNLDRCACGGVVMVKSSFPWDQTPQVRGAEVFAVDSRFKRAYYKSNGEWHVYRIGKDFSYILPRGN